MKILVFSDIHEWLGYERLVDRIKPEVVVLAGDLVCCGTASFWSSKDQETGRRMHVDKFYQFLRYTGKKSKVLVVKGNHDWDFKGDYDPKEINQISGCEEISGKITDAEGLRFLGLGFHETWYLRVLKPIIEKYKKVVDVVLMHGSRIRLVSLLQPKIIIRGGFARGKYLVHNIPSVFNNSMLYTIIELQNRKISNILQYQFGLDNLKKNTQTKSLPSLLRRYEWLKPYTRA